MSRLRDEVHQAKRLRTDNDEAEAHLAQDPNDVANEVVVDGPYHPQTCGKVERFHQTLKRFLAKQDAAGSIEGLQAQLDRFRDYYNTVRPHRAIGRRTPAEAFDARPKAGPLLASLPVPGRFRLRRDKVDITGVVTLRHNSRLHHIGIGRKLVGTRILVLVDGLQVG